MRILRLQGVSFLVVIGLLAVCVKPVFAAEIKCGGTLGAGGTFVLTHDLTCLKDVEDRYRPALSVINGAILDLNGHTVTCDERHVGIAVVRATLLNGTVRGCGEGVTAHDSVVTRMTLIENGWGVYLQGTDDNLIIANTAAGNGVGFGLEDGGERNTFIDNVARANGSGFNSDSGIDNVFIGNRASDNLRSGFSLDGYRLTLVSNVAKRNREGFSFDSPGRLKLVGNMAKHNETHGFLFSYVDGERIVVRDNVAKNNGGDGFRIEPAGLDGAGDASANVFKNNQVLNNAGHGIHVTVGLAFPPRVLTLHATIRGNAVLGHTAPHFDLADDNPNCEEGAVWTDNIFETASQACIE